MMDENIVVRVKNVYGNDTIYPVCARSKLLADMLGQKSLTFGDMRIIEELGFKVTIQQPTNPFTTNPFTTNPFTTNPTKPAHPTNQTNP